MDQSVTTTGNNLPTAGSSALAAASQKYAKRQFVSYPELKLYNTMMKVAGMERGEFLTTQYDPEKKEDIIIPRGKNVDVVILHRAYSYSFYDETEGNEHLAAWSSEFDTFDPNERVVLFRKQGKQGKAFLDLDGNAKAVKNRIKDLHPKGTKFTHVLYVLFEGKPYRMFVSNPSATGVAPGKDRSDYQNIQPLSLESFLTASPVPFGHACRLGSRYIDEESQFWIVNFESAKQHTPEEVESLAVAWQQLMVDLRTKFDSDLARIGTAPQGSQSDPIPVEVLSPDELPQLD